MAKVASGAYVVSFLFEDVNGGRARTECSIDTLGGTFTIADAIAFANDIAAAMQELSTASLTGYNITLSVTETAAPEPGGQAEDKALFSFSDASIPRRYTLVNIPGCGSSILQPNGIDIDPENADVADFVSIMTTAHVTGGRVVSASGENLTDLAAAYLSQRRSLMRRARRAG